MKSILFRAVSGLVLVTLSLVGCSGPKQVQTTRQYSREGHLVRETSSVDGQVISELDRVLREASVKGVGVYAHESRSTAREVALNLALNDIGRKLGEVVQESETSIIQQTTKDQILNVIRTKSRNIIRGYSVILDEYDESKNEATVWVQIDTLTVAQEVASQIM